MPPIMCQTSSSHEKMESLAEEGLRGACPDYSTSSSRASTPPGSVVSCMLEFKLRAHSPAEPEDLCDCAPEVRRFADIQQDDDDC